MRNRRKRKQREEVRKILAAIRKELASQRLATYEVNKPTPMISLKEVIAKARSQIS